MFLLADISNYSNMTLHIQKKNWEYRKKKKKNGIRNFVLQQLIFEKRNKYIPVKNTWYVPYVLLATYSQLFPYRAMKSRHGFQQSTKKLLKLNYYNFRMASTRHNSIAIQVNIQGCLEQQFSCLLCLIVNSFSNSGPIAICLSNEDIHFAKGLFNFFPDNDLQISIVKSILPFKILLIFLVSC